MIRGVSTATNKITIIFFDVGHALILYPSSFDGAAYRGVVIDMRLNINFSKPYFII